MILKLFLFIYLLVKTAWQINVVFIKKNIETILTCFTRFIPAWVFSIFFSSNCTFLYDLQHLLFHVLAEIYQYIFRSFF